MMIIFILLTFVATMLGGFMSLKYRHHMPRLLGFTAGVLLAVVAFDIIPEMVELQSETGLDFMIPMIALVAGFMLFHVGEKFLLIHHSHEDQYEHHRHPSVGIFSALALSAHSFLDGVGIALGFQISTEAGIVMAVAILAHKFADGINTVSLMLSHNNTEGRTKYFLYLNALAPVLGGIATLFFTFSPFALLVYLGFFAGFLLYIGAADILPEAHSKDSSIKTVAATVLGVVCIFLLTAVIHSL